MKALKINTGKKRGIERWCAEGGASVWEVFGLVQALW